MIVIGVKGGFGNQLFQYALYFTFKRDGYDVYLDLTWYKNRPIQFILSEYFLISPDVYYKKRISFANVEKNIFSRVRRKFWRKNSHYIENQYRFNEEIFGYTSKKNIFLDGYWQSYKYFDKYQTLIRDVFFPETVRDRYSQLLDEKYGTYKRILAIHVRRGDYRNDSVMVMQPGSFYKNALDLYRKRWDDSIYLVFSDDIAEAQQIFRDDRVYYVDWTKRMIDDFYLMASCDDFIISNSTFSYWSAFLSTSEDKVVYYPKNWFKHSDDRDISFMFPEVWLGI